MINWKLEPIEPIIETVKEDIESDSTKDMLRRVKDLNDNFRLFSEEDKHRIMTFSMDAEALYPSIRRKDILKEISYIVEKSPMKFEYVNYVEIGKYIAILYGEAELRELNIISCIPNRNVVIEGRTRAKPGLAYLDKDSYVRVEKGKDSKTMNNWSWKGKMTPTEAQRKK